LTLRPQRTYHKTAGKADDVGEFARRHSGHREARAQHPRGRKTASSPAMIISRTTRWTRSTERCWRWRRY